MQKRGVSDVVVVDEAYIRAKYQLRPCQLIDVKALMGTSPTILPALRVLEKKPPALWWKNTGLWIKYINVLMKRRKVCASKKTLQGKRLRIKAGIWREICKEVPLSEPLQPYGGIADEEALLSVLEELEMKNTIARLGLKKETEEAATLGQEELDYVRLDEKNL